MTALPGLDGAALTGNLPGYLVTFHGLDASGGVVDDPALVLHSDALDADISVSLTGDLRGGPTTLAFIGLGDDQHQRLAERTAVGGFVLGVARIHLFWRDTNTSLGGYLANLAGIVPLAGGIGAFAKGPTGELEKARVAEIAVRGVSRRRGASRYETVVTGTDRIAAATSVRFTDAVHAVGLGAAVQRLVQAAAAKIDVTLHPVPAADAAARPEQMEFGAARGGQLRDALTDLAGTLELVTGLTGRGMLLVHGSRLHVGVRPIPLGRVTTLSYPTGLLSVEAIRPVDVDGDERDGTARRDQWLVHLRGRPDLHPGEEITFGKPPGEGTLAPDTAVALFGSFAAPLLGDQLGGAAARGYITGVSHSLNRRTGFLTQLTLIELKAGEDGWDRPPGPVGPAAVKGQGLPAPDHPDPVVAFRSSLETGVQRQLSALEFADVGEVRGHRVATSGEGSAHRSTLWQGTTPSSDGAPGSAVRLPVDREAPLERNGVPYATPFAWGRYGLVVPRYPGTRVVSVHRHGRAEDPIDVGAVWPDGDGPDAHPGDWWLSLPADVPAERRIALAPDARPEPRSGTATNDLVDADGRRVIEVGSLRVRVGKALPKAGSRPEPAPDDTVLSVEHSDGTTLLRFAANGDVTIAAKGKLTLSGQEVAITATGKDVGISGKNVNVKVSKRMNVD